jgi:hypothetical protein
MPHPLVVNKRKTDDYDVDVSRPSVLGNPFVGRDAIKHFREYLLKRPDLLELVKKLRGKRLACTCAPKPCHADIIAEIAND